jgi:RHS repeat-associated protein
MHKSTFFSIGANMDNSRGKFSLSIFCIVLSALFFLGSSAIEALVYAELENVNFSREAGKPITEIFTFPSASPGQTFTLNVYNGGLNDQTANGELVSSAVITLNGVQVFGPSDFNQQVSFLSAEVILQAENTLAVELRGKPGGMLTVNIEAEDNDLPTIIAEVNPTANSAGWHNTVATVSFQCSDATSGIEFCSAPVTVDSESRNQIVEGQAIDRSGNIATTSATINLDTTPPNITASITPTPTEAGHYNDTVTVSFECGDILSSIQSCSSPVTLTEEGLGQTVTGTAVDEAGNTQIATVTVDIVFDPINPNLPPDPATVAPPLDPTGVTGLKVATEFLYGGPNPIQTGVTSEIIDIRRAAVVRGSVLDRDNKPLPEVTITIKDHSEFGQTLSRADGLFDLAVNGGGILTVNYQKDGYLPVQRQVDTRWNDFALADDVVMIPVDTQVTAVVLDDSSQAFQVAQGSLQTDGDGSRQATIFFPQGTRATMTLPGGGTQSLDQIHVRATEYTVGANGPETMPGVLPPTSGYTYAVELSLDEAIAASATRVDFSQPLPVYVDNFLDFPTGSVVPAGWYDREKAAWIASDNGRVIEILGVADGLAELDVDGSGDPASAAVMNELGITEAERRQLAMTFADGKSLWRTPVNHFTPWDYNWPFGPPEDAEPPAQHEPETDEPEPEPDCQGGSIIECQGQILRESIPIVGTPFSLNYRSDQMPGRKAYADIQLSGDEMPASLLRIRLQVTIAGKSYSYSFAPQANLTHRFVWDGRDAYGRSVYGSQTARIKIGYEYRGVYLEPDESKRAFTKFGGTQPTGNRARQTVTLWQRSQHRLQSVAPGVSELGGWTISPQHRYQADSRLLSLGSGVVISQRPLSNIIETVAGTGEYAFGGDGGLAKEAQFKGPYGMDIGPDGSLYVADSGSDRVRRIGLDGIITTVVGGGDTSNTSHRFGGDGGPATEAYLDGPADVVVAGDGSLYISDTRNHRIRYVDPSGIITTVAGTYTLGRYSGDEGLAVEAELDWPTSLALGSDGSLYIADTGNNRVRRVSPDGIITTIAGSGWTLGDGGPAVDARLDSPAGLVFGPDGNLYISDTYAHRIRRVGVDGIITTVAGNGLAQFRGDGGLAIHASLSNPRGLVFGPDGSLYVAENWNSRVRRISPAGIITTVAGNGELDSYGDGGPATEAALGNPLDVAFDTAGSLLIADVQTLRVRRVQLSAGLVFGQSLISSEDGAQLFHFAEGGRHLTTRDSTTGALIYEFHYDTNHRLVGIEDGDGNNTQIERDGDGNVLAMVASDGQRTALTLDSNGYLASAVNPAGESYQMAYTPDGLLTRFTDPNGNSTTLNYDELGYLTSDINAEGGGWILAREKLAPGWEYRMTSAEGRTTRYQVVPDGNGGRERTTIRPDGTKVVMHFGLNGEKISAAADGTETYRKRGTDPRFGFSAPVLEVFKITTPGGLVGTLNTQRSTVLADEDDLLSHTTLDETITFNGKINTRNYDTATRTWTHISSEGRLSTRVLDINGRPIQHVIAGLADQNVSYNLDGRLATLTHSDGTTSRTAHLTYYTGGSQQGFLHSITDAENRQTTFSYDRAGRITRQTLPGDRIISYDYDSNGNLISLTPPGSYPHRFYYTALNQEAEYEPPLIAGVSDPATRYFYNLDRQLERISRPDGRSLDYRYHPTSGKLEQLAIPRGNYDYVYNTTTGQLAQITAPDRGTLSFAYDGSLVLSNTWSGTVAGSVVQSYNNDFHVIQRCINGSNCINFNYDDDLLMTQAGNLAISREAQKAGLIAGTALGRITTSRGYNGFGELATYTADDSSAGVALYSVSYTRDDLGRITRQLETVEGINTTYDYTYDTAGRLTTVTTDGTVMAVYTYDANGNRLDADGVTATYDGQDRLLSHGTNTYSYTANGELTRKTDISTNQVTQFGYDVLGNLTSVTLPDGTHIEYLIDGLNRRIGKQVNGTLTKGFLYQDQLNPVAELDDNGDIIARFIYGDKPHVPAYMVKGGITYRIISNHLGSPRLVVNTTDGSTAQRIDYDAWGNITLDTNPGFQPFGFAGGLYDQHTKLTRFGARDYDAQTGRWTAKDPIKFDGGLNLYGYTANDPINRFDLDGLDWVYSQSTGRLTHVNANGNATPVATGYSGRGEGLNNPAMQNVRDMGPVPQGTWEIGQPFNSDNVGPYALPLTPLPGTETYGRDLFRMHGDNAAMNQSASKGCPIFPRHVRERVANSGDNIFRVVQ